MYVLNIELAPVCEAQPHTPLEKLFRVESIAVKGFLFPRMLLQPLLENRGDGDSLRPPGLGLRR